MNFRRLLPDITSGLTVSFAALSLGAAFGVMSGRGAFAGMIGAAVIPIITSIFGGTRLQASGPTAPMTAVSALVVAFAYDNFPVKEMAEQFITLVFILTGLVLIVAALARLGKLISLVPNVIVLGFMNGIAVLIWYDQLVKIFALKGKELMQGGIWLNLGIALSTFLMIYLIVLTVKRAALRPQIRSLLSGVLLSIIIMTAFTTLFNIQVEHVQLGSTTGSLSDFGHLLASYFPNDILKVEYIIMALPFALQLTLLAYLDSLLTALVVDKMTREKSNLNKELFAQGLSNAVSGMLQGIPGAQATIRSVLLIKEGAQTRLAGVLMGIFVLVSILVLKDLLTLVPAAVFIGVLFKAGLDVSDKDFPRTFMLKRWFRQPMRNIQFAFIAFTTVVTVLVDLNIAVLSGTVLFYIGKYFWGIVDVEPDFQEVSEKERKLVTG
ncbi:MAG: SulP family inorganic anion transporter [Cyclobacteriaceae bacterium]|nr:SulP family inorganic anion transporter [Cyclobacteriaceae bacterium]